MKSITEFVIQDDKILDNTDILHRPLFDVSIRLLKKNDRYNDLICSIVRYMTSILINSFSDYSELKGISGANVGIPFNIVVVKFGKSDTMTLINPRIVGRSEDTREVRSNCGSLRLRNKVRVIQNTGITVQYYDIYGAKYTGGFGMELASTIQHEVDHNQGILITDRAKELLNE